MSDIRKKILDVLFVPIPGFGWIPGVNRITGEDTLRKLEKEGKKTLNNHKIREEIHNIDIDKALMKRADVQNENDRVLQTRVLGKALFNIESDTFAERPTPPDLPPVMVEEFIELEKLKRDIRIRLRPDMEKQIEATVEAVKQANDVLTPELKGMFHELKLKRLTMVAAREDMMNQRQKAEKLVEAYLRNQNDIKNGIPRPPESAENSPISTTVAVEERIIPLPVIEDLSTLKLSEREIDALIDHHLKQLEILHTEGDELQKKIDRELNGQRRKMAKRAGYTAATLGGVALAVFGGREGVAYYNYTQPCETEAYSHVAIDPKEQAFSVFKRPYKNHLTNDERLDVQVHAVETGVEPWHGVVSARTMDIAYKAATGDANASADLKRTMLDFEQDSLGSNNTAIPFWKRSIFVPRRPLDAERMMTSTTDFHVLNQSIVSNRHIKPGSGRARKERAFLLSTTCPITIPCGNDATRGIGNEIQYIGELGHYPRYAVQIGEGTKASGLPGKDAFYPMGGHPYVFGNFPIPKTGHLLDQVTRPSDEKDPEASGSSFCSTGFGGNIAGQKSLFPQLNWDNIYYASALASQNNVSQFRKKDPQKTPHTDITFYRDTGFGMIDPEMAELILNNMLYQRLKHPEIVHDPQVIVRDTTKNEPAKKVHKIRLPKDKDVFKVVFDILHSPSETDGSATVTDEYGNSKTIILVKGEDMTRYTDWSLLGAPGTTITVTTSVPTRLEYAAHVNNPGAVTLGLNHREQLKPIEEINKLIDQENLREKLKALPVSMPVAPRVVMEQGQEVSMRKEDPRKGLSWHDDTNRTYAQRTHKRWQELDGRSDDHGKG